MDRSEVGALTNRGIKVVIFHTQNEILIQKRFTGVGLRGRQNFKSFSLETSFMSKKLRDTRDSNSGSFLPLI